MQQKMQKHSDDQNKFTQLGSILKYFLQYFMLLHSSSEWADYHHTQLLFDASDSGWLDGMMM